jgi:hypothetical protein
LNFGERLTVATSVPSFARMMLRKLAFENTMPLRAWLVRSRTSSPTDACDDPFAPGFPLLIKTGEFAQAILCLFQEFNALAEILYNNPTRTMDAMAS